MVHSKLLDSFCPPLQIIFRYSNQMLPYNFTAIIPKVSRVVVLIAGVIMAITRLHNSEKLL